MCIYFQGQKLQTNSTSVKESMYPGKNALYRHRTRALGAFRTIAKKVSQTHKKRTLWNKHLTTVERTTKDWKMKLNDTEMLCKILQCNAQLLFYIFHNGSFLPLFDPSPLHDHQSPRVPMTSLGAAKTFDSEFPQKSGQMNFPSKNASINLKVDNHTCCPAEKLLPPKE